MGNLWGNELVRLLIQEELPNQKTGRLNKKRAGPSGPTLFYLNSLTD